MLFVAQIVMTFLSWNGTFLTRLLSQSFKDNCLSNISKEFCGRHIDLLGLYKRDVCEMLAYFFSQTNLIHFFCF